MVGLTTLLRSQEVCLKSLTLFFSFSLIVQLVKNLPAMQETLVRFLSREDPLEKGKATYSSILGVPWWLSW